VNLIPIIPPKPFIPITIDYNSTPISAQSLIITILVLIYLLQIIHGIMSTHDYKSKTEFIYYTFLPFIPYIILMIKKEYN
jgi:hypothetical protein